MPNGSRDATHSPATLHLEGGVADEQAGVTDRVLNRGNPEIPTGGTVFTPPLRGPEDDSSPCARRGTAGAGAQSEAVAGNYLPSEAHVGPRGKTPGSLPEIVSCRTVALC